MLNKLINVLLILSLVFFFACSEDDDPVESINEFELLTEVGDVYYTDYTTSGGMGVNIGIGDVFTNLTDGDDSNDPFIIDWRGQTDFDSGHLQGAVNWALGDLVDKLGEIPAGKTILNVCYTGQTASVATATLNMLGYEAQNLLFGMCGVSVDGSITGTDKWNTQIAEDEYVLNKTAVADPTTEYDFPELNTGEETAEDVIKARFSEVTAGWGVPFATVIASPADYFIINYWSQTDYDNIGHIEGAYQFDPNSAFKSDMMLKNLPTNKKIAVYCWTGQTSAQVTAYLRLLGYDAYSIYYGVNGFAYGSLPGHKYTAPTADYSSIIE